MPAMTICPRCVGDMVPVEGLDGPEWVCIQCRFRRDVLVHNGPLSLRRMALNAVRLQWEIREVRFDRAADIDLGAEWLEYAPVAGTS